MKAETSAPALRDLVFGIKGGGDLATGVVLTLFRAGFHKLYIMEADRPTVIRRQVAFASALFDSKIDVEGVTAVRADGSEEISDIWSQGRIPVLADPGWQTLIKQPPHVLVDAVIAKKNLGTRIDDAPLVMGLGPGFTAGKDVHLVVETQRGHHLARIMETGAARPNTSQPEAVMGITGDRLVRSPAAGSFTGLAKIGELVAKEQILGHVDGVAVAAKIGGALRGLIHDGVEVTPGRKIGDIDPRGDASYCQTVSDKARALGGAVLGAVLGRYNR